MSTALLGAQALQTPQYDGASLVWRLGPTHFLEEVLPPSSVTTIYELGPNYVGSFQAVCVPCEFMLSCILDTVQE